MTPFSQWCALFSSSKNPLFISMISWAERVSASLTETLKRSSDVNLSFLTASLHNSSCRFISKHQADQRLQLKQKWTPPNMVEQKQTGTFWRQSSSVKQTDLLPSSRLKRWWRGNCSQSVVSRLNQVTETQLRFYLEWVRVHLWRRREGKEEQQLLIGHLEAVVSQ